MKLHLLRDPLFQSGVLTSKGVLVVFGVERNRSFIQLPGGHKIPMVRENGAMVLIATSIVRRDMTRDLVASVVPTEVPGAFETRDVKK